MVSWKILAYSYSRGSRPSWILCGKYLSTFKVLNQPIFKIFLVDWMHTSYNSRLKTYQYQWERERALNKCVYNLIKTSNLCLSTLVHSSSRECNQLVDDMLSWFGASLRLLCCPSLHLSPLCYYRTKLLDIKKWIYLERTLKHVTIIMIKTLSNPMW